MSSQPPPPPPPPPGPGPSPGVPPSGPPTGPTGPRAGFWARLAGSLIDGLILGLVGFPLRRVTGPVIGFGAGTILGFVYAGYLQGSPAGQTVGERALGIRVVRIADGGPLGWGTALLRHLCGVLSALALGLGYLWMLWDGEKQTWHDKLSATVVVPAAAWPPPADGFGRPPEF